MIKTLLRRYQAWKRRDETRRALRSSGDSRSNVPARLCLRRAELKRIDVGKHDCVGVPADSVHLGAYGTFN
jgi:hypothetical protein